MNIQNACFATLEEYRMEKFAEMRFSDELESLIEFTNDSIAQTPCGVYVWVIEGEIVRIGSSKEKLRSRIRGAGRWLQHRLQGTAKTKDEIRRQKELADALRWKKRLYKTGRHAEVWGRGGTIVRTPIGEINTYLAEENALLQRHKPALNNSHFR